jgi:putative FmdB family regulatory protein
MPIYEYECQQCGHQLEKLQKFSDAPLVHCPECEQDALKKLISSTSFKLTGTGWYETDFKNKTLKEDKSAPKKEAKAGSATEKKTVTPKSTEAKNE